MASCKQIIELASSHLETPLPRWQRWQLKLHLLICRHCRRYMKQLRFLQRVSITMQDSIKSATLSPQARNRIAQILKQQQSIE